MKVRDSYLGCSHKSLKGAGLSQAPRAPDAALTGEQQAQGLVTRGHSLQDPLLPTF